MTKRCRADAPPSFGMVPPDRAAHARQPVRPRAWLTLVAMSVVIAGCATAPLPSATEPGLAATPAPHPPVAGAALPPMAPIPMPPAATTVTTAPKPAPTASLIDATDSSPASGVITVDPADPTVRLDLSSPRATIDLYTRLRGNFAMSDLDNDLVRRWEQWYAARPDYVQRMTERGGRYLFHIVNELERRNMPGELALLPYIESAYNPQAMSSAKASGMWQFIPGTGRDYALKQNIFRDDRREVLASTQAALDYLKTLHGMFGDWHLALAAYNWGQGNVQKAINRNQKAGLATDYDSLRMPDETRNYVPKLQAVKNIMLQPERFSLTLSPLKNHPYFVSVGLDRDIDLARAAAMAELPLDEFKALNPQMNKPVILAAGTPQVLLPYDNANLFVRALNKAKGPLASWTAWVVPKTMSPSAAAAQVGMSEAELRAANNIPPRMLVKAGSTLLVTRHSTRQADVAEAVADNATLALTPDQPPFRRISFKAGRKGDSVAAVAKRYRVGAAQVAAWNQTSVGARFQPGAQIVVQVPRATAARSRTASKAQANKPVAAARATGGRKLVKPTGTARSR